ncbi:hypothetical protein J5491_01245 [Candidatus Saccharibacteria bacterium]|nr:hypothetical protein [Candidatus Saccharibacteria bacterium]
MREKKCFRERIKQSFLGYFFAFIVALSGVFGITSTLLVGDAYAEPDTTEVTNVDESNGADENTGGEDTNLEKTEEEKKKEEEEKKKKEEEEKKKKEEEKKKTGENQCQTQLEAIGWLVCPTTGKIAEAVDWLYGTIEELLVVNPVEAKDGAPIYEIWKYCRGVTNIVFIIFLLVVIYSQLTGLGINNYGLKKALPKLIVAAVLVNLSFLICQLGIDLSNIIGNGLRGVFTSVQETVVANMDVTPEAVESMNIAYADVYSVIAGGAMLTVGAGMVSFENGTIWMLIPIVLGAVVAVASGLITIALRQAVVALLVMVAPLAIVVNILPNTEKWFKKWKDLLVQMLVFYPMFSLLFGASSLAGFAIIASAKDAFWLIVGIAVQVFPLFFSWSLMKMSGTVLGTINAKMRGIAAKPIATTKDWADSRRQYTKAKNLAARQVYTPSLALMQYMSNRKVAREAELADYQEKIKNRGLAYKVSKSYDKYGAANKRGVEEYARQSDNMNYTEMVERHKNNLNEGLGDLTVKPRSRALYDKIKQLDVENIVSSDYLKMEKARGEVVEYNNAKGYYQRMEDAINAHFDEVHQYVTDDDGTVRFNTEHKIHDFGSAAKRAEAMQRYNIASGIMKGNLHDTQYAAAYSAQAYDTQKKILDSKRYKYVDFTPPTKDLEDRLNELTTNVEFGTAAQNIDSIIPGLRVLNQRGDTDLLIDQIKNVLAKDIGGGVKLGTHASQALASFLMFEVKNGDPALRRFGKYINLETANVYNKNKRKEEYITYDEYLRGYHEEPDGEIMYAKKDSAKLLEGTSFDEIERTALSSLDENLKKAYGYDPKHKNREWDVTGYLKRREKLQTAFEPAFLSASLKWMSGSEQINSGVKFWTGYELQQQKDGNGNSIVDENYEPVYDLNPVWENPEFKGHEKEVEEYYRRKTGDYFKDQTTGQILGMRTDYRDPTMEHMLATYLNENSEEGTAEEKQKRYKEETERIKNKKYGKDTPEEEEKARKKELKDYKMDLAGRQVRKIMGETGKMKQIYRTRPSGTAINAKDWLRKWMLLDDEDALRREMNYYDKKNKKEPTSYSTSDNDNADVFGGDGPIYSESDRETFVAEMENLRDRISDEEPSVFYEDTRDQLVKWFTEDSIIVKKYEQFYRENMDSVDNLELYNAVINILSDRENYPDA